MNAFEVVTIVVSVVAIALAATQLLPPQPVLGELGRRASSLVRPPRGLEPTSRDQPNEDDRDAPIPKRPLRGRMPE